MDWNKERAVEAMLYIANRIHKPTIMKVCKLLYLSDVWHLQNYGRFVTSDNYVAMKHGPVPSNTYDELKKGRNTTQISPDFLIIDNRGIFGVVSRVWYGFYINSGPQNSHMPKLTQCDFKIKHHLHRDFLRHDSWINVNEIHGYDDTLLGIEGYEYKGTLNRGARRRLLECVQKCPILPRKDKVAISEAHQKTPLK